MISAEAWRDTSPDLPSEPEAAWLDSIAGIYAEQHAALERFVNARARGEPAAEDVVHEAFARLVRQAARGAMPDSPVAWLYRVSANIVTSHRRHLRMAAHKGRMEAPEEIDPPDHAVLAFERARDLQVALANLTPDARRAVVLAAHGYSGPEIASELGRTSIGTRALLFRSRRRLRTLLTEPVLAAG